MDEYIDLAKAIALEAGDMMLEHFGPGADHTLKEDLTPLTETDVRINDHVLKRLHAAFPEHSLMGEEGTLLQDHSHVWVFDPIDGTKSYLRGIPTNVFSLALVIDGDPVLGVVYDPYLKRLYTAQKGQGARLNDMSIRVNEAATLSGAYIEIGGITAMKNSSLFDELRARDMRVLSHHSSVYGHMLVASGQIEGVVFPYKNPWDCAAAKVIVEEAGGVTGSFSGESQRYDRQVCGFLSAATPELLTELRSIVVPSFNTLSSSSSV